MPERNGLVLIEADRVLIVDRYSREVVSWTKDELAEDGDAAIAAASYVQCFYEQGIEEVARRLRKDISDPTKIILTRNDGTTVDLPTDGLLHSYELIVLTTDEFTPPERWVWKSAPNCWLLTVPLAELGEAREWMNLHQEVYGYTSANAA